MVVQTKDIKPVTDNHQLGGSPQWGQLCQHHDETQNNLIAFFWFYKFSFVPRHITIIAEAKGCYCVIVIVDREKNAVAPA